MNMSKKTRNKSNSSISLANHRKQQQQQQQQPNKKQTNRNTTTTHSTHNPKPPKPTNKPPLNHDYYDDDKVIKPENVIYLDEAAQNEDDNVDAASSDENVDYSSAEQDVDGLKRNDAFSSSIVDLDLSSSSSCSSLYFRPYSNLYFPFFIFTFGRYFLL